MNATSSSGAAWVRRTPTGRFVAFIPRSARRRPSRLLRMLVVTLLLFLLLIGG